MVEEEVKHNKTSVVETNINKMNNLDIESKTKESSKTSKSEQINDTTMSSVSEKMNYNTNSSVKKNNPENTKIGEVLELERDFEVVDEEINKDNTSAKSNNADDKTSLNSQRCWKRQKRQDIYSQQLFPSQIRVVKQLKLQINY